jgi:hypothetical protein
MSITLLVNFSLDIWPNFLLILTQARGGSAISLAASPQQWIIGPWSEVDPFQPLCRSPIAGEADL